MTEFETLERLLTSRRSCRGYLPDEVRRGTIEQILAAAQHTASWCNTQPWQVHIVSGEARAQLSKALVDSVIATFGQPAPSDFPFPKAYAGVYDQRRKEVGWQLYEAVCTSTRSCSPPRRSDSGRARRPQSPRRRRQCGSS